VEKEITSNEEILKVEINHRQQQEKDWIAQQSGKIWWKHQSVLNMSIGCQIALLTRE
jgi:hypothetical protein